MLALIKLSVFASSIALLCYTISIRKLGMTISNLFINLIPVFTAIMAYLILGDELSRRGIVGIGIVTVGLFIAQYRSKNKNKAEVNRLKDAA